MGNIEEKGATLLGQLVTISILSILLYTGVPATVEFVDAQARRSALNELKSSVTYARALATKEGVSCVISFSSDGRSFSLGPDFLPYNDPPAADEVVKTINLGNNLTFTGADRLTFNSQGFLVDNFGNPITATLTLSSGAETFQSMTVFPTGWTEVTL